MNERGAGGTGAPIGLPARCSATVHHAALEHLLDAPGRAGDLGVRVRGERADLAHVMARVRPDAELLGRREPPEQLSRVIRHEELNDLTAAHRLPRDHAALLRITLLGVTLLGIALLRIALLGITLLAGDALLGPPLRARSAL